MWRFQRKSSSDITMHRPANRSGYGNMPSQQNSNKNNKIYLIYAEYYEDAAPKSISVYDMNTKQTTRFANYSDFSNPGNIVVDPATGDVIIIDQPFSALNDIYVYGSDGVLKKKLETGYYTTNMRFVTE